jgi:diguanylate cyclase (GGDEF)-like protein
VGGLFCRHVSQPAECSYLDVPMMASGEAMGVLYIERAGENGFHQGAQDLAKTVAEHLALSLSNLRLRETLRAQSIRDSLTGLFNRRYMEESLDRELHRADRRKAPVGIIMLDIDHFKDFNDTYGHDAGDLILRELGTLLQRGIRKEDIACRLGGEEFILILPDAPLEVTRQRAERIREEVQALHIVYLHQTLGLVTVSLGVAVFPENSTTAEGILRKVDEAMYRAKRQGRNCVAA